MILGHRCETGTGRCRNRRVDSGTSGSLWQVQQDAAIPQIEFSSFAETEDTVRAEPRQCSIPESKLRARITLPAGLSDDETRERVLADAQVQVHTKGKTIRKVVMAKGPLVSIVVG